MEFTLLQHARPPSKTALRQRPNFVVEDDRPRPPGSPPSLHPKSTNPASLRRLGVTPWLCPQYTPPAAPRHSRSPPAVGALNCNHPSPGSPPVHGGGCQP